MSKLRYEVYHDAMMEASSPHSVGPDDIIDRLIDRGALLDAVIESEKLDEIASFSIQLDNNLAINHLQMAIRIRHKAPMYPGPQPEDRQLVSTIDSSLAKGSGDASSIAMLLESLMNKLLSEYTMIKTKRS